MKTSLRTMTRSSELTRVVGIFFRVHWMSVRSFRQVNDRRAIGMNHKASVLPPAVATDRIHSAGCVSERTMKTECQSGMAARNLTTICVRVKWFPKCGRHLRMAADFVNRESGCPAHSVPDDKYQQNNDQHRDPRHDHAGANVSRTAECPGAIRHPLVVLESSVSSHTRNPCHCPRFVRARLKKDQPFTSKWLVEMSFFVTKIN